MQSKIEKIASLSPPSIFLRSHSQFSKKCVYLCTPIIFPIYFGSSSFEIQTIIKKSIYFCRSLVSSQDEYDANCYFFSFWFIIPSSSTWEHDMTQQKHLSSKTRIVVIAIIIGEWQIALRTILLSMTNGFTLLSRWRVVAWPGTFFYLAIN